MPLTLPNPVTDAAALLTLRNTGTRLVAELHALLRQIPAQQRKCSTFSRWLGVDRSVCYRMLAAMQHKGEPVEVFRSLPGVDGYQRVIKALSRRGIDRARIGRALAAGEAYAQLVGDAGGSQAKLVRQCARLLEEERSGRLPGPSLEHAVGARGKAMAAAAEVSGCRAAVHSLVYAVCRDRESGELTAASVQGMVGLRRKARHLPIVLSRIAKPESSGVEPSTFDQDLSLGWSAGTVLGVLSSDPLPVVTVSRTRETLVTLLDPKSPAESQTDIFIGGRFRVSAPDKSVPRHSVSMIPRVPAEWSVMDVYLHPNVGCITDAEVSLFYIGAEGAVLEDPASRWYDRLEGASDVQQIGRGLTGAACDRSPKQRLAAQALFDATQWDAMEFSHVRFEMPFPLWGVQQLLEFAWQDEKD